MHNNVIHSKLSKMSGVLSKTLSKIEAQRIPKKQMPWDLMVIPFNKEKAKIVSKED